METLVDVGDDQITLSYDKEMLIKALYRLGSMKAFGLPGVLEDNECRLRILFAEYVAKIFDDNVKSIDGQTYREIFPIWHDLLADDDDKWL